MKPLLSCFAALSLSVAAVIGVSGPAWAHSDELKTSPEQGSTVEAGRIPITLTFGEELLTGDDSISHEVVVVRENGEPVPALCASADGFDLSTAASIDQPGKYVVTWRTVSADGHPVDGSFDFNVVNNTDYDAASDAVDACVTTQMTEGEPMVISAPPAANSENSAVTAWILGGSLLASAFAAFLVIRKVGSRKRK
jgi:methionine-rich copper-binding protein CopC